MKYQLSILWILFLLQASSYSQTTFLNPIISGGYPDPSICKVGDVFYIVNSSFEYFPALPIHKSKDLVNWELIGYGLNRIEQVTDNVNLKDVQSDGGIHAPTIRYHNGKFYIITTNIYYDEKEKRTDFVNFIITADKAEGPWSQPHVIEDAPGIDPDIFFDDDGKVWYTGTHSPDKPNFQGEGEIWLQELDIVNWKLIGKRHYLWRGACGGVWAEGPHIYKRDNRYYLMIAEGGTSFNHAVMIAVSDSIKGHYIPNERNPILSTRHLTYDNWVHSVGHADLIEIEKDSWYMVALGVRGDEKRGSNMGRETHLLPVIWEREPFEWKKTKYEWLVVAPKTGKLERINPVPFKNSKHVMPSSFVDDFTKDKLNLEWNFRRVPLTNWFNLDERKGYLRMYSANQVIENRKQTSLMGIRQKESDFVYEIKMSFNPKNNLSEAGISLFQKDNNYINYLVQKRNNKFYLKLITSTPNTIETIKETGIQNYSGEFLLKVVSDKSQYNYYYSTDDGANFLFFHQTPADLILSKGYTGAYLGLYVNSTKSRSDFVDVDRVKVNYSIR